MNDAIKIRELERENAVLKTLLSEEQKRFVNRVELFTHGMQDAKFRIDQLEKEIKDIETTDKGLTFRLAQASLRSLKDIQKVGHSDTTCMYYYDFVRQGNKGPRSCTCELPILIKLTQQFGDRHFLPPLPTADELAKRLEEEKPKYDKLVEDMDRQGKIGPGLKDQIIGTY